MMEPRAPLRQRRELSQIMENALRLYGQNFAALFRIAMVVIPLGIAVGIFQTTVKDRDVGIPLVGALAVGQFAVNLLASAALIASIEDIEAGRPPDFTRTYDAATERFWTLMAAFLRSLLIIMLLVVTIIGIPWAIQRLIRWVFIEQAVILDHASAKDSLSRSADAVIGSWWRTLGIWFLISLMGAAPALIVTAAFSIAPVAVSSTATAAIDALMLPFIVVALTLLYFDLQSRKEPSDAVSVA